MEPEIVCLTEVMKDFVPKSGHCILSESNYGYANTANKHKAALWSKNEWKDVDTVGSDKLPGGRFVSGLTKTSIGVLSVIGICIPWKDAHVRTGRRDKLPWQEHADYLNEFRPVIKRYEKNTIIAGDFNQRIYRYNSPVFIYNQLMDVFGSFDIGTAGIIPGINKLTIDHIVFTKDLQKEKVVGYPNIQKGIRLSDHDFITMEIRR
jgi:hypothetical protein